MMSRRGGSNQNNLSPQDSASPPASSSSQAFLGFPRSTSPSSNFAQFLTKPSKWFGRSNSGSKVPSSTAEPRTSTSSGRKHKISRPTDPRPILDTYAAGGASKSVLDLSTRAQASLEMANFHPPSVPSSPVTSSRHGLGDLRNVSRKAWSKSVDDLGKAPPANFSPINTNFHDKVLEYRGRSDSNASAMSPSSPTSICSVANGRHPFPTVITDSPSSSPPRSATLPSVSISAPSSDDNPQPPAARMPAPTHVHTRSHSFTPKLPSKLAPRYGTPSTPNRKGSSASEKDILEFRDQHTLEKQSSPMNARGHGFGFGFGGLATHKSSGESQASAQASNARSTTFLAPPTIVEPQPDDDDLNSDPKRSSQIIYHTGFLNRLADVPNHQHASLAKGWKPFKAELKGSKVYFFKPPNDRATAVKELFPIELVPPSPEDEDEESEVVGEDAESDVTKSKKGRAKDEGAPASLGRKKRAFWGRRTHPDLVKRAGVLEKGTFEALVHEAVFGTTFMRSPSGSAAPSATESEEDEAKDLVGDSLEKLEGRWKDFASSVLMCIPSLVGQQKFEIEFLRCCDYLVSGAGDAEKEQERGRVGWLAGEYLKYHSVPADMAGWEQWRTESIPDIALAIVSPSSASSLPPSASTQAVFAPSPAIGGDSPNINTFSPRPDDSTKLNLLIEALRPADGLQASSTSSSVAGGDRHQGYHRGGPGTSQTVWAALEQEGLSRDILSMLDPQLVARSLTVFHRSVLENAPANITVGMLAGQESFDTPDSDSQDSSMGLSDLFGNDEHPHWLTKFVLLQILGADTSMGHLNNRLNSSTNGQTTLRRSEERPGPTSRTHSRSEVISVWIKVGELCRIAGDECSWKAISAALCSRPIARLEKVWKRVDPLALAAIEAWVYPSGQEGQLSMSEVVGSARVEEPRVVPWGGDVRNLIKVELAKARAEGDDQTLIVEPLENARKLFEGFRTAFCLCPRKSGGRREGVNATLGVGADDNAPVNGSMGGDEEDVVKMVGYWRTMAESGGGVGGLAAKFHRVDQFISLSLAAESRRKGLFEPYYWSRTTSTYTPYSSLLPLLFPEPLPTVGLVDRAQLLRGRVDSDASEVHLLRSGGGVMDGPRGQLEIPSKDANRLLTLLGRGGTVIPVFNGDLLLVVQIGPIEPTSTSRPSSSRAPSRPPSSVDPDGKSLARNPSIRVKPGSSQGLDRKASVARRSSLPSVSNRANFVVTEPSSEPPLRVLVQSGTLNKLVEILVHGLKNVSVSVADDNGEMSLREGMTRELVVDHVEFANVWWNVFRSFVTPLVFFELLRKLYITSQPPGASPSIAEYLHVVGRRFEVLGTIKEWVTVGGGAQDILDDAALYDAVRAFLDSQSDHTIFQSNQFEDPAVRQAWASLMQQREGLAVTVISHAMRPPISRAAPRPRSNSTGARRKNLGGREPPDLDQIDPEDLVDILDGMASAAFSNVAEEDLFVTADLLEVQSADKTGWFSLRDVGTFDEVVEIQTIYSHLQEVEPSTMISELAQDAVYRLLPPSIRSCVRAYGILRKWLIASLVAPRLGLRTRQQRMELLLQAIEITRLRNAECSTGPASSGVPPLPTKVAEAPCVKSFVEAVITSAVVSIESRVHHRAWQNVALGRGVQCDTLSSLLSKPTIRQTASRSPLTVDMGWLIERMLEIVATPDVVDSIAFEGQNLVNFDKRRPILSDDHTRRGFERLNSIEKEVSPVQFDLRNIKEEAVKEATSIPPASTRKTAKPFQRLVALQMEKNRRDRNLRARMQKEKLHEQSKNEKRDEMLNRAMRPRKSVLPASKQHRNKKSMSAFLHFMRPISSAFGADITPTSLHKRSPSELDFKPSGKPTLVLSLMDAQVSQFINNERSFTFQLDTEDGGHYLLQAVNRRDMMKWINAINRITKMVAKRRLTYLGNSPKPQLADHLHDHPKTASRDPKAVFGVELNVLLERETGGDVLPGIIPSIIERCLTEIEARGLTEVGIYRIAGAVSEIQALKEGFNRGEYPIQRDTDIHAVCDLVKTWFRILPEPIFPSTSYHDVIRAMQLENLEERLESIRAVVHAMPQANFDLIKRVSEHLDKVTDFEEHNHMTAEALAIVFSPNLLRAPQNDFVMILSNMGHTHKLVKTLITHFHTIFDDGDPEADARSEEDEFDSPIIEEEEEDEDLEPLSSQGHELYPASAEDG
ncbi:hypothetical protein BDN72DRAFT_679331 [Pluteus cervinus]|uniref:Uncharacterized protein n=1 Tax=Pluteus cervinus TaxID=181527 RepID=A0ACD3ARP1_9AGAR|nr:hypothetical protein BDN72DRAFT_679331 [Pluteus cervinus]